MQINNLTEGNVSEFSKLADSLKETNPELEYRIFNQDSVVNAQEYKSLRKQVDELAEIIGSVELKLKHIFGNHILINGQFKDIKGELENIGVEQK